MLEPLYTSAEMRVAEEGHDVDQLMARAGRAVAEEALRRFPDVSFFSALCGGGANGGDARIALEALRAEGRQAEEGLGGEVIIDGLFGTGFRGEPRSEAAKLIEALNGTGRPVIAVDLPSGVDADTGEIGGDSCTSRRNGGHARAQGRQRRCSGPLPLRRGGRRRYRTRLRRDSASAGRARGALDRPQEGTPRTTSTQPATCSSSVGRRG